MVMPVLGIMTLYLNDRQQIEDKHVYAKMTVMGKRLGLNVYVFTPADVDDRRQMIYAHVYNPEKRKWMRRWLRFPHLIYDRCRIQRSKRFEQLLAFRRKYGHLTYLNRPLRNKWTVYQTLGKFAAFRPHLPATRPYRSAQDVLIMLRRYPLVFLKPVQGTGGRGILRIDQLRDGTLLLQGRNRSRRIVPVRRISRKQLPAALRAWARQGDRYIVQQGIRTELDNGRVHDYRLLVQKNGHGQWQVSGCAGRIGPPRSVTSNLHGGGKAAPMNLLLRRWIGHEGKIERVRETAEWLGVAVARTLEASYGALCELALDLAVDRSGRVWLLEVNPKPAREVFIRAGDREAYRKAILRPLEYALWVYRQKYNP
jgi:glutathione synthase/RimK-type ligase-like ATP-grasp enzyme